MRSAERASAVQLALSLGCTKPRFEHRARFFLAPWQARRSARTPRASTTSTAWAVRMRAYTRGRWCWSLTRAAIGATAAARCTPWPQHEPQPLPVSPDRRPSSFRRRAAGFWCKKNGIGGQKCCPQSCGQCGGATGGGVPTKAPTAEAACSTSRLARTLPTRATETHSRFGVPYNM